MAKLVKSFEYITCWPVSFPKTHSSDHTAREWIHLEVNVSEFRWEPWIRWMVNSPQCINEVIQTWCRSGESSNLQRTVSSKSAEILYNSAVTGWCRVCTVLWISGTAAVAVRTFVIYSVTAAVVGTSWAGQTLDRNNHTENWRKFVCRPNLQLIGGLDCHRQREWTLFDGKAKTRRRYCTQMQRQRQES